VNAILNSPKTSREFDELVIETGSDGHLHHSEVWWISRDRVVGECGICDRNFLCDVMDKKIIKLFSFAICFGLLD